MTGSSAGSTSKSSITKGSTASPTRAIGLHPVAPDLGVLHEIDAAGTTQLACLGSSVLDAAASSWRTSLRRPAEARAGALASRWRHGVAASGSSASAVVEVVVRRPGRPRPRRGRDAGVASDASWRCRRRAADVGRAATRGRAGSSSSSRTTSIVLGVLDEVDLEVDLAGSMTARRRHARRATRSRAAPRSSTCTDDLRRQRRGVRRTVRRTTGSRSSPDGARRRRARRAGSPRCAR